MAVSAAAAAGGCGTSEVELKWNASSEQPNPDAAPPDVHIVDRMCERCGEGPVVEQVEKCTALSFVCCLCNALGCGDPQYQRCTKCGHNMKK